MDEDVPAFPRPGSASKDGNEPPPVRASPFRFKEEGHTPADGVRHRAKRRRLSNDDEPSARSEHRHRRRHHHHGRHRHHRHEEARESTSDHGREAEEGGVADPDAAFRESLFDAMADDEGADFWQGVYGQPIHVYENTKEGAQGELERMTDDEYVAYVRARMWAKSHQGILEERARREQAARQKREQERNARAEAERFQKRMEESLQRGERRRTRKAWLQAYQTYNKRWDRLKAAVAADNAGAREMPWPVWSGQREDVTAAAVEEFLQRTAEYAGPEEVLPSRLKTERVRWHPDKMQQRFGAKGLGEVDLKTVTAVFQIMDDMWTRDKGR